MKGPGCQTDKADQETLIPMNENIFLLLCIFFFHYRYLLTQVLKACVSAPWLGWFLVGCFCAERPPLFLIFLSSLWDGRARLLLWLQNRRLPPGHQTAAPHWMYSLRGQLFRVCQSLLVVKCVKRTELGKSVFAKRAFMARFTRFEGQQKGVSHIKQGRQTASLDNNK